MKLLIFIDIEKDFDRFLKGGGWIPESGPGDAEARNYVLLLILIGI